MTDFSQFDNEMSLANEKSGIAEGNNNVSDESLRHLLYAVNNLGDIVKEISNSIANNNLVK